MENSRPSQVKDGYFYLLTLLVKVLAQWASKRGRGSVGKRGGFTPSLKSLPPRLCRGEGDTGDEVNIFALTLLLRTIR